MISRQRTYRATFSLMGEDRFNELAWLNVYPEIEIEPEEEVDVYAQKHHGRIQLL